MLLITLEVADKATAGLLNIGGSLIKGQRQTTQIPRNYFRQVALLQRYVFQAVLAFQELGAAQQESGSLVLRHRIQFYAPGDSSGYRRQRRQEYSAIACFRQDIIDQLRIINIIHNQ